MGNAIKILKERMSANPPILFLGAGFSIGAKNRRGEVPKASDLQEGIFQEFYCKKNKPKDVTDEDIAEIRQFELSDLCNTIQQESDERKEKLKEYLVKKFRDVFPPSTGKDQPFHYLIVQYPWKRIYTLNIDDLVENIYEHEEVALVVQNQRELKKHEAGVLELYKLHGCVNQPELGFVFSTSEYEDTIIRSDFKLQRFCDDYYDNDVIFLGTEWNESDISLLLKKYLNAGYKSKAHKYFFVSPNIKVKLKNTIKNNSDYYHIPWTTEQFLRECADLKEEDDQKQKWEQLLKQYSYWNLDENKEIPHYFESKLYFGNAPIWADIFDDWDFLTPNHMKKLKEIQDSNENLIISVSGKAYVGKTVLAKRILVEFYKIGFRAFEFDFKSRDEMDVFIEYMKYFSKGTKVALLVEEAALHYYNIVKMLHEVPENIERFIIVTTSRRYYHLIKRHELLRSRYIEMEPSNQINSNFSYSIFEKLKEKNRLGELSRYASNENDCRSFIRNKGNIVDLLYTLNHGRGFQEYFLCKFDQMRLEDEYKHLFNDCCLLSSLGVTVYPDVLIQTLHKKVTKEQVTRKLEDVIDIDQEGIKVRCSEIFEQKVISELTSEQKRICIEKHLVCIDKRFYENCDNVWEGIFEKLLKTKALVSILNMDKQDIRHLFVALERKYEKISYYWMQRGIFLQSLKDFENAELFLNQALNIRPNSYQIRHALAKNNLERSLYELNEGRETVAPYYFGEGEKRILELIESPYYSNALCYSVHTYIDMKIKYCKATHTMTENVLMDLYQYLLEGARVNYDRYIKDVRNTLYECASKSGLTELAEKLSAKSFEEYAKKDYIDMDMMELD